jgi:hypothetical protein
MKAMVHTYVMKYHHVTRKVEIKAATAKVDLVGNLHTTQISRGS